MSLKNKTIQTIITSIYGTTLTDIDKEILTSEIIAGVILFRYNFENYNQLQKLTTEIKNINPNLTISVDHEGGRVWRFDDGFTKIPPMATLGEILKVDKNKALNLAFNYGETIAKELKKVNIDFSYTPVLDINYGNSSIIGNRAFADNQADIITIASSFIDGVHNQKSPVVAKHFPGHGFVKADSHLELPIDDRNMKQLEVDISPYKKLINKIDYIMPAHIIYPKIDSKPASFSKIWLRDILRDEVGFKGKIISDDLSMNGAKIIPEIKDRVKLALNSGNDMVLICNDISATLQIIKG